MTRVTREFANMSELVRYCESPRRSGAGQQSESGNARFTGTDSMADALAKVFRWDEGAAQVTAMRTQLNLGIERFRSETYRSAQLPGAVSMSDYIAGRPKPVIARRRTDEKRNGAGKVIRIVVNPSASAGIDTDVIMRRGAAVMALAEAIEKRGGRVEIVVRFGVQGSGHEGIFETVLKRAGVPLNLNTVAFAMAHPSMLRRLLFKAMEVTPNVSRMTASMYGTPWNPPVNDGEVYLPAMGSWDERWQSAESATEWVNSYLRDNGWIK